MRGPIMIEGGMFFDEIEAIWAEACDRSFLVVTRVLGLTTPESIILANFWGEREESNLYLRDRFFLRNRTIPTFRLKIFFFVVN
jgi:hypothetical protein